MNTERAMLLKSDPGQHIIAAARLMSALRRLRLYSGKQSYQGCWMFYLGGTGYQAQQTSEPVEPDRPDNLFKPVPGEFAAHGSFDQRAAGRSPELWLATYRHLAAAALVAGA